MRNGKEQREEARALSKSLDETVTGIVDSMGHSSDLRIRQMTVGKNGVTIAVIYMDGLVNKKSVRYLLGAFTRMLGQAEHEGGTHWETADYIQTHALTVGELITVSDMHELEQAILAGYTFIAIDGIEQGTAVETQVSIQRQVSKPTSQSVVRGPQEGFTEQLSTNIALVRKKIRDPKLWLETMSIGHVTKTTVAVMYMQGIVESKVVEEVQQRLKQIRIDGILESNYIEEFIRDNKLSPFPTVYNTERPDVVAAALLEGKVAILVDGTPFALLVPALFTQFLQSAEDYYHSVDIGFLRLLRFGALFISMLAPALYIAVTTFHQEMLPTPLLISLAAQREGIPFPAFLEALIMEITFEMLREASVRMPKAIGTAISIVGALVLGQAAVEAGLVSAGMVIVVCITAITGFIFPRVEIGITTRLLRFAFMALAATLGLFGIVVLLIFIVLHLCHIRSFGIPYMTPFAPFNLADQSDNLLRAPWWKMRLRPQETASANAHRQPQAGKSSAPAAPADTIGDAEGG